MPSAICTACGTEFPQAATPPQHCPICEEERQFVVTLVFSKLVNWMRGQEGTPDLRALAYNTKADESHRAAAYLVLNDKKLMEGAIQGMFQYGVADPYSAYMPPSDYQSALGDLSGKFEGIGAEMALKITRS